ncbi:MAG: ATP-binding cassette domain-containing protein [Ilumatobacteraceae bacterium]
MRPPTATPGSASNSTTRSARRSPRDRSENGSGQLRGRQGAAFRRARQTHPSLQGQPDRAARWSCARTDRAIERLEQVDKPRQPWQLQLRIAAAGRPGDVVARLDGAVVEAGTFTLGPIDLQIEAGDRIGLIGANGAGKTTMLAALFGDVELAAGSRYVGPSVVVGEIDQVRGGLTGDRTLLRAFQDEARADLDEGDVRTLLAKFGLVADHVVRPATTLSPGERTRASLALVMANSANVLVLDEPTNHLDLPAIEQLEAALDSFDGTIVLVSHDRTLLDHVSLDRWLRLAGGRLVD